MKIRLRKTPVLFVDSDAKVEEALRLLDNAEITAIDTEYVSEPKGYSPVGIRKLVSVQFYFGTKCIFVPNWGKYLGKLMAFKKYLEDPAKKKIFHNAIADMHAFENHGIKLQGLAADTMVMAYILNTDRELALKTLITETFGIETKDYRETFKEPKPLKKGGFSKKQFILPLLDKVVSTPEGVKKLIAYAVKDPIYTFYLYEVLKEQLEETPWVADKNMWDYYQLVDLPYTSVLYRIERRGCRIDKEKLVEINKEMRKDADHNYGLFLKAAADAGVDTAFLEKLNLKSKKQLKVLFVDMLGADIKERTKKGAVKMDAKTLSSLTGLAGKVAEPLKVYNNIEKLRTTYVEPFIKFHAKYNGRVHTSLKQCGTATARLSSGAPNLQNIPQAYKDKYGIRACFIAEEGHVLADGDQAQIEIRVMAHMSKDDTMITCIRNGWDFHSLTCTKVSVPCREWLNGREITKEILDEVKVLFKRDRDKLAKPIGFGVGYGMGAKRFAAEAGCSEAQGQRVIDDFFALYPKLKKNIDYAVQQCRDNDGYVTTWLRRRAHIPDIRHPQKWIRLAAERKAYNYRIQGSNADLMRLIMIICDRCPELKRLGVKMILQIHDELLFQVPEQNIDEAMPLITEYMSHPYRHFTIYGIPIKDLAVDTPAEVGWGMTWQEAK